MSDRFLAFTEIQKQAAELFARKNADYGYAFVKYGPVGVIVCMEE